MSAIRTLIDAHRVAARALRGGLAEAQRSGLDVKHLVEAEASVLNALIAEPARSVDQAQAKARYLLDGEPDAVGYLCGNPELLQALLRASITADPALYAIQHHRTQHQQRDTVTPADSPAYSLADAAELEAWRRLVRTVPTTLDGIERFAAHVAAHPDLAAMDANDGPAQALRTIADAFSKLGVRQ